jgi:hypothetical protein
VDFEAEERGVCFVVEGIMRALAALVKAQGAFVSQS